VDYVEHHERAKTLRQHLLQNAVPITSVSVFAFVLLKVMLVARANANTALSIVQTAGTMQILSGVIVLAIPFLATGINNAVAIWAGSTSKFNRLERRRLWIVYTLSLFYLSLILPWASTLLLLAFSIYYGLRWLWRRRKVPSVQVQATTESTPTFNVERFLSTPPEDVQLRRLWLEYKTAFQRLTSPQMINDQAAKEAESVKFADIADQYNARQELVRSASNGTIDAAAIALLLSVLLPVFQQSINDKVWLPPEVIKIDSGSQLIGYVISESSEWTTVLTEKDRKIVRLPTDDLTQRTVCRVRGNTSQTTTVYRLFGHHEPDYPVCPDTPSASG
jgi:hypothetical protein